MNRLSVVLLIFAFLPVFIGKSRADVPFVNEPISPVLSSAHTPQVYLKSLESKVEFRSSLELVGVILDESEGKHQAIIENRKNKYQEVYTVGATLPGGMKILGIQSNSVVLEKDGVSHKLELRQSPGDPASKVGYQKLSPNEWSINARKLFPGLWDIVKTFEGIDVGHTRRPDGTEGLRINELSDDHILKNIGFEEGDIVEGIDGQAVDNVGDLLDYLWGLDDRSDIVISLDRQGKKKKITYHSTSDDPSYSRRQVKNAAQDSGLIGITATVTW